MIVKANQPSLLQAVTNALAGPDADFASTSWTQRRQMPRPPREAQHPCRPRRRHRLAARRPGPAPTPPSATWSPAPSAAGFANIAHAHRYYDRDDQRILALYGYT